jgi:hypothetical protein
LTKAAKLLIKNLRMINGGITWISVCGYSYFSNISRNLHETCPVTGFFVHVFRSVRRRADWTDTRPAKIPAVEKDGGSGHKRGRQGRKQKAVF